jgi:hypothetical protein
MSKEYKCEFCGNFQSTKGNLDRHQRTKKNCIEIQKAKGLQVKEPVTKCHYCNKEFNIVSIKAHSEICSGKKEQTIINNNVNPIINVGDNNGNIDIHIQNTIQNITLDFTKFFTDQKVAEIFQEYKSEHALEQMRGLAKFIIEKMLLLEEAPGYYLKDGMRNIFAYDSENGIKYDDKGDLLRKKIKDGATDQINIIVDGIIQNYSSINSKKSKATVQDMKDFKKEVEDLDIEKKLMTRIKSEYTIKNKEERLQKINNLKDTKNKIKEKSEEVDRLKKIDQDRINKIKQYKFNMDNDRKDCVLSKGHDNEPLSFTDKPILEELGLRYTDFFIEELM